MKKTVFKKVVAAVLSLAMVVTGLYVVAPQAEEVKAADSAASVGTYNATQFAEYWETKTAPTADGKVFAGWFTDAECTTAITDYNSVWAAGAQYYAKFVDAGVLSVKVQLSNDKTQMRVLSSVDSLDYKEVGFEVYFDGATTPVKFKTTQVFKTIDATEGKVAYEYGTKVIDENSEYFVSGTIKGINSEKLEKDFYIKPYWTTTEGVKVYGQGKMFSVNDGVATDKFNITIPGVADPSNTTVNVTVGGAGTTAEVVGYKDGNLFLNVAADKAALDSTSKVEYNGTAYVYNKLKSAKDVDTSWYDVNPDADVFYISSEADLWGLESLCKGAEALSFEGKTIVLLKDLVMNEGKASDWYTNGVPETVKAWTALNTTGSADIFKGTFDGNGHTISGLYMKYVNDGNAFIGRLGGTLKNLRLENSYSHSVTGGHWRTAAAVGIATNATVDNVYVGEDVFVNGGEGGHVGGVVSETQGVVTINECWFAGTVYSNRPGDGDAVVGGILGVAGNSLNPRSVKINNCLVTGTVIADQTGMNGIGGITGFTPAQTTIKNSLFDGTITAKQTDKVGSVSGQLWNKSWYEDVYTTVQLGTASGIYGVGGHDSDSYPLCGLTNVAPNASDKVLASQAYTTDSFVGDAAFENMNLDFWSENNPDGVWVVSKKGTPELKAFTKLAEDEIQQTYTGSKTIRHFGWYALQTVKNGKFNQGQNQTFEVETAADLFAVSALLKNNGANGDISVNENFNTDTIKLLNDIDVNPGWDASTKTAAPVPWDIWGYEANSGTYRFYGTLDGDFHTIRGIYVNATVNASGLCGELWGNVQELTIANSYYTSSAPYLAAIAGRNNGGNITDVYVAEDVIVETTSTESGGIVGRIMDGNLTRCWVAGTVSAGNESGGIIGSHYNGKVSASMTDCLFTGNFVQQGSQGSAIIGTLYSLKINFLNCLNNGTITDMNNKTTGSAYIALRGNSNITAANVYDNARIMGDDTSTAAEHRNSEFKSPDQLNGAMADLHTELDFSASGAWAATAAGPQLKSFTKLAPVTDFSSAFAYDYSWYTGKESETSYEISSAEQMYAFAELVNNGNKFEGKTITLTADIDLNPGWDADKANNTYTWTPIALFTRNVFSGTFDGAGKTISGIAVENDRNYAGLFGNIENGTVKNLKISNSNITNSEGFVGSVAGRIYQSSIIDVYADETVTVSSEKTVVGGIVARYDSKTTGVVERCWFAGLAEGLTGNVSDFVGGIIGEVFDAPQGDYDGNALMKDCLFTGTAKSGSWGVGGLIGHVWTSARTIIQSCVSTGKVCTNSTNNVGPTLGHIGSCPVETTNVYAIENVYRRDGVSSPTKTPMNMGVGYKAITSNDLVPGTAESTLTLDFTNTWAATQSGLVLRKFQ